MGLYPAKNARIASHIVNLTSEDLYMYDETSGDIELLPAYMSEHLRPICLDMYGRPAIYYIVEDIDLSVLAKHRSLLDIAVVIRQEHGRDDVLISYLGAAADTTKRILLDLRHRRQRQIA